jgi:hypothetical protein
MKLKTTKSEIRNNTNRILGISAGALQHLLKYEDPFAYSSGVYGWNCDYYQIEDIVISVGYRPIKSIRMNDDYEIIRTYEELARVGNHTNKTYQEIKEINRIQLLELIKELKA